jgi:deoxyribodipyrimidine photo-lyase
MNKVKAPIILLWYKRDLRIQDHFPLTDALTIGAQKNIPVIAIYVFEPFITSSPDFSLFHRQCIEQSLICLATSLQSIGIELIIFERKISDVFKEIQEKYIIAQMLSHEETGNGRTYSRDKKVAQYFQFQNIVWKEYPSNGVVRRLKNRHEWQKIWKARMSKVILPTPLGQKYFQPYVN